MNVVADMNSDKCVILGGEEPLFGMVMDIVSCSGVSAKTGGPLFSADLLGRLGDLEVGISVDMMIDDWDRKTDLDGNDQLDFYYGDLRLRSLGEATDHLIDVFVSEADEVAAVGDAVSSSTLILECVSFGADPIDIMLDGFKGKIFFGEKDQSDDGQLFLRLDIGDRKGWFGEKDPIYRPALAGWFSKLRTRSDA